MSTKLGFAMIIREDDGTTTYDKHSLRSPFEGDEAGGEFGNDDDDELDGDDFGDDFGDELGDELADDVGDETGDDVGDEVGGRRKRLARKAARVANRAAKKPRKWQRTAVAGSATIAAANGSGTITITPATYIRLKDITFTGTGAANGSVKSITVGDRLVWSSSTPVPTAIFASTGFLRNMLDGSVARPGVPILVEVVGAAAADVITATLLGSKPISRC